MFRLPLREGVDLNALLLSVMSALLCLPLREGVDLNIRGDGVRHNLIRVSLCVREWI